MVDTIGRKTGHREAHIDIAHLIPFALLSKHGRHRRFPRYPSASPHRLTPLGEKARRFVFSFVYCYSVCHRGQNKKRLERRRYATQMSASASSPFQTGRHRRFPRYPIVHLPCPELSGVRHNRSESVLSSDQVYHSLKLRCKLAVFTVVYHFEMRQNLRLKMRNIYKMVEAVLL